MIRQVLTISPGGCLKNAEQRIAFRVDASSRIGTGHVMRCLTLADELKRRGAVTCFVGRQMPDYLHEMLVNRGCEVKQLVIGSVPTTEKRLMYADWLGISQEADAHDTLQALSDTTWDWLVVDHYALDAEWESRLREVAGKILVIDDLADRQHDCDLLLDQNFYTDMSLRYEGKVSEKCQMLLGPRYALLREEFRALREHVMLRDGSVHRILVFFGGVDADNYTGRAILALSKLGVPDIAVDVVIGAQHPSRETIESECLRLGFSCYVQTERMAELMSNASLSIGAGGSAAWERCCLALPTLIITLAENQVAIAEGLDSFGASLYLGEATSVSEMTILSELNKLISNPEHLKNLSEKSYSMLDGMGVVRVCEQMGY